ncbi:hypothetical protein [Prevotella sp.]|uniref:hypothetical protein n=1 Tax=Prevotella sp. TaxID=59823 RepID=UPI002E764772|nr:hypothetical protein [Prevotella sp.]MEE0669603.1 hypothetical protein [Prevotella sp.]
MENIDKIANIDAIANAIKNNSEDGFFFVPWIGKNYNKGLNGKKVLVVGASHYCNHSNICIHQAKKCSNSYDKNKCRLGCKYFQECTSGKTKDYNDKCAWMKESYSTDYVALCKSICDKIGDSNMISEKLNSTTLGEICNFLDPNWEDNVSYTRFTEFGTRFFDKELTNKIEPKYNFWSHIAFVNYAQNFQPASTGNNFKENDFDAFKKYLEVLKPDIVIVWGCALGGEMEKKGFKVNAENNGYNWTKDGIQFVNIKL